MPEFSSKLTPAAGGVFTVDVGVITGPVELHTSCGDDGAVAITVRYDGADEWYAVRGGTTTLHDPADAEVLHATLVAILDRPES